MKNKLTYISLFSSAGVGCFGFKQNNFECIATNEILTKRLKIQVYNNKCKFLRSRSFNTIFGCINKRSDI